MNFKIITLLFSTCLYTTIGYTQTGTYLISNNIIPKYNLQLHGSYPSIKGAKFKEINDSILTFITTNFDKKDKEYSTEVSFEKISQNRETLSFSIDYNISNSTERYFNKYYTLNLLKEKELSLSEYLEQKKIPKSDVINNINYFISLCTSTKKLIPDYCSDMTMRSLLENDTIVNYSKISSFYIKNNNDIGIGVDSNKFTTTFIYNIKTKQVSLK